MYILCSILSASKARGELHNTQDISMYIPTCVHVIILVCMYMLVRLRVRERGFACAYAYEYYNNRR